MARNLFSIALNGGRFGNAAVPLEYLKRLAAWNEALRLLARDHYMSKNPGRQRVPNGFHDDVMMRLRLEEGSTMGVYECAPSGGDSVLLDPNSHHAHGLQAARGILSAGDVPPWVERKTIHALNRSLGGLEVGEDIDFDEPFTQGEPAPVRVAPEVRNRLLDHAATRSSFRTGEYVDVGHVYRANKNTGTFALHRREGRARLAFRLSEAIANNVLTAFHRGSPLWIHGRADYVEGRAPDVEITETTLIGGPELRNRLNQLRTLPDGWLDGDGQSISAGLLARVEGHVWRLIEIAKVDRPYLYPTPEGGVLAEWDLRDGRMEIDFQPDGVVIGGAGWGSIDTEQAWLIFDANVIANWIGDVVRQSNE